MSYCRIYIKTRPDQINKGEIEDLENMDVC